MQMSNLVTLLALVCASSANALRVTPSSANALRVTPTSMKLVTTDDVAAATPPCAVRTEAPCASACASDSFFGGGGSVPEGAKCIFRKNAPCNRKKCQVNKGPCSANHKSMK